MSVQTPTTENASIESLSDRETRALTSPMTVIDDCGVVADAPMLYEVTSDSGNAYIVDMDSNDGPRCSCKDHQYRGVDCAHIERVRYEIGEKAIPAWVDTDALDEQLGEHVTTGQPRIAMTDGGVATEQSGASVTDRPAYIEIGIDGNGNRHCYDTKTETVHIVHGDGTRERAVIDPSKHTIIDWITHIRQAHGWESMEMWRSQLHALIPAIDEREEVSA